MTMISDAPALQRSSEPAEGAAAPSRIARYARPVLGVLLPLALALGWELVVWSGWSNGRLVPPPSRVFVTITDLARSGELVRHIAATLWRVGLGFAFGVVAGTLLGAISGYWSLARAGCSIRPCRHCARYPRWPGCRCSSSGSVS
ncbi:hypothetical protein ABIF50_002655 [Bradyrhizobium diazoefficiens]